MHVRRFSLAVPAQAFVGRHLHFAFALVSQSRSHHLHPAIGQVDLTILKAIEAMQAYPKPSLFTNFVNGLPATVQGRGSSGYNVWPAEVIGG